MFGAMIQGEGQLHLVIKRKELAGIGLALAVPTLVGQDFRLAAERASEELASYHACRVQKALIRVEGGWLSSQVIKQAGIGLGKRALDGTPLSPIVLTPVEIINPYSKRLQGPWAKVEVPPIELPESKSALENASVHLEFLRRWGIPGGIIGHVTDYENVLREMLAAFITRYPQARVLVIGFNKTLKMLGREWSNIVTARFRGNKSDLPFTPFCRGVILATPKGLTSHPEIIKTEWNILCLLAADGLVRSNRSRIFKQLANCRKMLMIGLFGSRAFVKTPARAAMAQLFGLSTYTDDTLIWEVGLRNPKQKPPTLPNKPRPSSQSDLSVAEFTIGTAQASGGLPIPPRPSQTGQDASRTRHDEANIRFKISYSTRESGFVEQAKKLVNHHEKSTQFVPFMQYWPTYEAMTETQQKWYFYWRNQVRKSNYPDTDLSYIFVHVYELINKVGVQDANDGYLQLRQLWLNYRERHPKLDKYLIDWLADYVLVNNCKIDYMQIYASKVAKEYTLSHESDLYLSQYLDRPFTEMPIALIDALTDYRIQKSKFYNGEHRLIVDQYLPQTLELVNQHLVQSVGMGIWQRFHPRRSVTIRRRPFGSAVYDGQVEEVTLATVLPYARHQPLRDFLTGVVKHTENKLRELKNFRGRLRSYQIAPTIKAVIERFMVDGESAPPPKPKVEIDLAEVERLRHESKQIFQILQVADEEATEEATASARTQILIDHRELQKLERESEQLFRMLEVEDAAQNPRADKAPLDLHIRSSKVERHSGALDKAAFDDLPEEWTELATQLADYQFEVINAIIALRDPSAILSKIADANTTMPELLIDGINELALDTIGDIVIEAYPTPHISEEEYLEVMQEMVAIASQTLGDGGAERTITY